MSRKLKNINPEAAPLVVTDGDRNRYGLTAQEEKYAQLRAAGADPKVILAQLGIAAKSPIAWERKNPAVVARVTMLQDEAAVQVIEKIKIDKEVLVRETWELYQACKELNTVRDKLGNVETAPVRASEATKQLELLAKLEGLLVQKSEVRVGPLESLSDAELTRIAHELAAAIGFDPGSLRVEEAPGPQQT